MVSELSLGVALLAGVLSFLSPCIVPIVPGYLAYVTGGKEAPAGRRMGLTGAFVGGFSLAFVALGVLIGLVGSSGAFRSFETWAQRVGGVLIIAFGLALWGLLRLPWMDRDLRYHGRFPERLGPFGGALALGAAFGVGWSPCVGPILGAILLLAGLEGGAATGGLLLAAYAAGLAIPFIILGATADRGARLLRRYGRVARGVEIVGGLFLVLLGIFVFTGATARLTSWLL